MKKYEWWKVFLLSMVTFGIYGIVWWYQMTEAHNEMAKKYGVEEIKGYIIALLLGIITCGIYTIIWTIKFMDQNVKLLHAQGKTAAPTETPALLWLITYVPIYSYIVVCDNHNKLVD